MRKFLLVLLIVMAVPLSSLLTRSHQEARKLLETEHITRIDGMIVRQRRTDGALVELPDGSVRRLSVSPRGEIFEEVAKGLNLWSTDIERQIALSDLLDRGVLRESTEEEYQRWVERMRAAMITPPPKKKRKRSGRSAPKRYTLMEPLSDTILIAGKVPALIVPEHLDRAQVPQGASGTYFMASGTCWGKAKFCTRRSGTASAACFGELPPDLEVHGRVALGPNTDRHLRMHFETSMVQAGQIDVYVAATEKPVALALAATHPTVWAFDLEAGAKLAAVHVRGKHGQAVSGLPPDIPATFATRYRSDPACGEAIFNRFAGAEREAFARDIQDIFGRTFDSFETGQHPFYFEVGGTSWLPKPRVDKRYGEYDEKGVIPRLGVDADSMQSSSKARAFIDFHVLYGILALVILNARNVLNLVLRVIGRDPIGPQTKPSSRVIAYLKGVSVGGGAVYANVYLNGVPTQFQDIPSPFSPMGLFLIAGAATLCAIPLACIYWGTSVRHLPRGWREIATGALLMAFPAAFGRWTMTDILLPFCGALGGWQYWKARGYPGDGRGLGLIGLLFDDYRPAADAVGRRLRARKAAKQPARAASKALHSTGEPIFAHGRRERKRQ